jgi:hypothetical protein
VNQLGWTLFVMAFGVVGAVLSVAFLLLLPTDGAPSGYGELIFDDLPVVMFAAGTGFVLGALIPLLWSGLQRLFPASAPRV